MTAAEAALETAYTTALAARTTLLTATAQFTDAATTAETAFETTYTTAPGIAANVTITELQVGTP
ncbi:hypothetical protein [Actinokineospora inagensis]|uniref:hypothetical protein n=1 Tax=Actinokineospora inagensis TaxID=103730 RepID=UPI0004176B8E|nr:hypothetical protein [Actinokineospora inagensis]